ncbi:MAG: hypothetical protein ACLUPV_06030 [Bilophila wadsworthia]
MANVNSAATTNGNKKDEAPASSLTLSSRGHTRFRPGTPFPWGRPAARPASN